MAENLGNDFVTTLNGSINNSTTAITVASGTGAPAANFRIRVNDELMLVTSKGAGTNWTATRGIEGTVAVAHNDGTPVAHVITLGGLAQYLAENYSALGHNHDASYSALGHTHPISDLTDLPTLAGTTYTPTLTNVANAGSLSHVGAYYMRQGSLVTVGGKFTVTPTTGGGTTTRVGISLPVASNFSADDQLSGSACTDAAGLSTTSLGYLQFVAKADATNDRAELSTLIYTSSNVAIWYQFIYRII